MQALPAKAVLQMSADDVARHVGVYGNGDGRVEITADGGQLFVTREQRKVRLIKRSADGYETETGGSYVFSGADEQGTRYVISGSRSFSRMR